MNSDLICPWYSWAPLLPSWNDFILANKQAQETSYLFIWQSRRCMFIWPCIWEGPDVGLEKKALGCHRSKPPASQDLKRDDTSNIQHTVQQPRPTMVVGLWPSPLARGVWNTDQFGWSSQQLSQAKGAFVKLGCQILKFTEKTTSNRFGGVD